MPLGVDLRQSPRPLLAITLAAAVSMMVACSNPVKPEPVKAITTGQVVLYTTATTGWSSISVNLDGVSVGTLTAYPSSTPGCGSSSPAAIVVTKAAGTYTFSATSNAGTQWSGTVTITAGACSPSAFTCTNGNCGSGGSGGSGGSSTGTRSVLCGTVVGVSSTSWVAMPNVTGLDVKLYFSTIFNTAEVQFRNRYAQTMWFSYGVYRSGINPAPATTYRRSMAAGEADSGSIGSGSTTGVALGGQACVVVDQVRWGPTDSGAYFDR
jgi:hypothetical protein